MAHSHTHGEVVGGRPILITLVLNIGIVGAQVAVEAHLVMNRSDLDDIEQVKHAAKKMLHDQFGVGHTTLEIELDSCTGKEQSVIPEHE